MIKSVTESIMYGFVAIDKLVIPFIEKTIAGMLPKIEKCQTTKSETTECEAENREVRECEAENIVTAE